MRLPELGHEIRKARLERDWTQARLAQAVGLSRETLNRLESGRVRDLGLRKVLALADQLGLTLTVEPGTRARRPDYLRMACTSASVSYRTSLTEDELVHALLTGKVPARKSAHLRTLFDEAPAVLLNGLAAEAARWTQPGKVKRNLERLADAVEASRKVDEWLKTS